MAFFDMDEPTLRTYPGQATLPDDFADFWHSTLAAQLGTDPGVEAQPLDGPVTAYQVLDVSFLGYGGARINAWVRLPLHVEEPRPAVISFIGYSGARGYPWKNAHFAEAGYIHITMDSRSQGWRTPHFGATSPDPDPARGLTAVPGVMTSGILDRDSYYYRRLYMDAVRVLQVAAALPEVDATRLVVTGVSQGGGMTLAAAGLAELAGIHLAAVMPDVPFLCDFPRAVGLTDAYPYSEIVDYLNANPQFESTVFRTLSYFDGVNFARYATAPALFSTGLMDQICPPSTVFGAYNSYAGRDKQIRVWRWNGHEGGQEHMIYEQLAWLKTRLS